MGDRKTATAFFNQGLQANQQKGDDPKLGAHAYQLFASACFADPTWFHAYYQCGNNNSDLKLYFSAIADWRRALECEAPDKERAKACANLGWRLHNLNRFPEARVERAPRDALMPVRGTLSVEKARRLLGYAPRFALDEGIEHYVEWYRSIWSDRRSASNNA